MGKLHELLAVKKDLAQRAGEVQKETSHVFTQGHLFQGSHKAYFPFEENDQTKEPPETVPLSYTVGEKASWFAENFGKLIDAEFQIEKGNLEALADLAVDHEGARFTINQVPSTFLLDLISFMERVRTTFRHMPVLDPKHEWADDTESDKKGVKFVPDPEITYRTKKVLQHKVLVDASDKHPAQVEKWYEDQRVGKYEKKLSSGALTPRQKADVLHRIDLVIEGAKKALSKANDTEHPKDRIAEALFHFILGDVKG